MFIGKVFKIWNVDLQVWMTSGRTPGNRRSPGKVWSTVGHMKQALSYQLGSLSYYLKHGYSKKAKNLKERVLDGKEMVTYEMIEVGRVPLKEWWEENRTRKGDDD